MCFILDETLMATSTPCVGVQHSRGALTLELVAVRFAALSVPAAGCGRFERGRRPTGAASSL